MTWSKKLAHLVEYLRIYWSDFAVFSPYESAVRIDDGSILIFQLVEGRYHGNQIM